MSQWCRLNGVDRRTFYRHRARVAAEGTWAPRSRRPKTSPGATPAGVAAEVIRLRQELARVTEQRDILKKAAGILSEPSRNGMP